MDEFRKIKILYNEFKDHIEKYPLVVSRASAAVMRYEPKWNIFNQEPYMELVAAEFMNEYPKEASELLRDKK